MRSRRACQAKSKGVKGQIGEGQKKRNKIVRDFIPPTPPCLR